MSAVVILAVGVAIVLALPIAWRVAQRRFDPFEPILVFALAWGVMFVVRPLAIVIRDDTNFHGVDIGSTLDKAVLLALLGGVAFVIGNEAVVAKRLAARIPATTSRWTARRALVGSCIASGLGMASLAVFLLSIGGTSAVGTFLRGRSTELDELMRDSPLILFWFSLLVIPGALTAFAVAVARPRYRTLLAAALLIALALLRIVPTGSRLNVLVLIGAIVVVAYLHRSRRPGLIAVVVGFLVALTVSYSFLFFRYAETRESFPAVVRSVGSTPDRIFAPVLRGADAEMAPALAGALRVIPADLGYAYGEATLVDLVARPVPRVLWNGKPLPHTQRVTGIVWPEARELGGFDPAFTPLLSFFWDFGLLGVVIGMFGYGLVARGLYEYLLRTSGDTRVQVVYAAALWTVVVAVRFDPVLLVMHLAVVFIPMLLIFRSARSCGATVDH